MTSETTSQTKSDLSVSIRDRAIAAKRASRTLAVASSASKDAALVGMADALIASTAAIRSENEKDLAAARASGLSDALVDRLTLTSARIESMADGLRHVTTVPDPVGEVMRMWTRPNGLRIGKVRVPLGVVGIIYESRPNVTADAAGLCLKSGNAVILRGGSEAIHSNTAIATILRDAVRASGLPDACIEFIETTDREAVDILLRQDDLVDVIIPRGGKGLIRHVVETSSIPVVRHEDGICHVYVDAHADLRMAEEIAYNAKVQRPSVCNAMETLLVHQTVAPTFLPKMCERLVDAGVELRGCERARDLTVQVTVMRPATDEDWRTEYLDLVLSIRVVSSFEEAIEHIETFGSHHSDAIVTDDYRSSQRFLSEVDSAVVLINASTRFSDGYEFGLGAEIGISTQKLHARGPMGLEELTTYKFIVYGDGQIRAPSGGL